MIATIKHLPETLADRCIVIPMHRKTAEEKCERLKGLDGQELRRKCARFVLDHAQEIERAQPQIPEDLNDRAGDIWEPLLALADLAGGEWPERARKAALGLTVQGQLDSPIGALLFDILICFLTEEGERIFSRRLVERLNGMGDRPWSEIRRGQQVTEMWLAQQLRVYGIRPRTIWIGKSAAKGYLEGDFGQVFKRYIPKAQARMLLDEASQAAGLGKAENGGGEN